MIVTLLKMMNGVPLPIMILLMMSTPMMIKCSAFFTIGIIRQEHTVSPTQVDISKQYSVGQVHHSLLRF
jgi:hypothetical protein